MSSLSPSCVPSVCQLVLRVLQQAMSNVKNISYLRVQSVQPPLTGRTARVTQRSYLTVGASNCKQTLCKVLLYLYYQIHYYVLLLSKTICYKNQSKTIISCSCTYFSCKFFIIRAYFYWAQPSVKSAQQCLLKRLTCFHQPLRYFCFQQTVSGHSTEIHCYDIGSDCAAHTFTLDSCTLTAISFFAFPTRFPCKSLPSHSACIILINVSHISSSKKAKVPYRNTRGGLLS